MGVNELLFELSLDNVNMFVLLAWIAETKLVQKLNGFVHLAAEKDLPNAILKAFSAGCPQVRQFMKSHSPAVHEMSFTSSS